MMSGRFLPGLWASMIDFFVSALSAVARLVPDFLVEDLAGNNGVFASLQAQLGVLMLIVLAGLYLAFRR